MQIGGGMMGNHIFNLDELDDFSAELLNLSEKKMPKETKQFMQAEGRKLKQATKKKAKSKTDKKTGNYYKGIKSGKVYQYSGNGGTAVRVYGGKPAYHAHLLEYGHRLVQKGKVICINGKYITVKKKGEKKEIGFVPGLHVFEESRNEFKETFYQDIESFLNGIVRW